MLAIGACSATQSVVETETQPVTSQPERLTEEEIRAIHVQNLTPEQVAAYEQQLVEHPDDILTRSKLLGHYARARITNRAASRRHGRHVVWMIRHAPNSYALGAFYHISAHSNPEGYVDAKRAWEEQIERHPDNAIFLDRFASFLGSSDRDHSIELLRRALEVEPDNGWRAYRLGSTYLSLAEWSHLDKQYPNAAEDALEQFDRAYELGGPGEFAGLVLTGRAKSAFLAKRYDLAADDAREMLNAFETDQSWNRGNLVHDGHMILGRIALIRGDVADAKVHLLESGKTPGSPQLASFGPNMSLALSLLEKGEFEVVSEYFELCSVFWQRPKLDEWKLDVKSGRVPDFGANLLY